MHCHIEDADAMFTSADDTISADESFWEIGQYRRTVKRVDDGYLSCKEFTQMVKERIEIEQKHATMLKEHAERWKKKLDHGTMKLYLLLLGN